MYTRYTYICRSVADTDSAYSIRIRTVSFVMRGLDPRIHADLPQSKPLRQGRRSLFSMDCRVEPGNDERRKAIQVERHMV
jgi:hypothetical protein